MLVKLGKFSVKVCQRVHVSELHPVHQNSKEGSSFPLILAHPAQCIRSGQLGKNRRRHAQNVQSRSAWQASSHQAPVLRNDYPLPVSDGELNNFYNLVNAGRWKIFRYQLVLSY